ncbi:MULTISPECIES: D-alanyl-D-alanine carboxypeptidase/D-alanyl-D-alanine-endopeptidase [Clostridia]|uniref:D-alanyl-D-alanine carboxypeptidase/D-alanyl-D-alanine endopeptidase n=1 Tax=Clostridia TaxID=186801 RepID=UPI000EA3F534|nr:MULTISPECIES: D-alanyl-D-alanine carboxypeptidase/D-alanyl-D-alanine-endopeptidase [Clostridia]NBJ70976.1 D-alanyl-D-alanine carboxypeptidase/D-alanyl-D-alanine-endopeptidase [Roseburia sp. 1XD42-34]RKI75506.1 D-alanyl-D-alanine carboxypeptidase/D-alanyl-D-alanine-endopeptidase [Clostridium sp. 1xD42-85]
MKEIIETYITKEPRLRGALIGISIREADTGKVVYEHMGDIRFHPASNMKLLTAVAGLNVLGEKYRFTTELNTDGVIENGILKGNLYIVGKGDPTLLPETYHLFARRLNQLGIGYIAGDIIGDDTWYDAVRLSQDIIWSDETYHYAAQIAALTVSPDKQYDAGSVYVKISPRKHGEPANVTIFPKTDYVTLVNKIKTGEEENIVIEREYGGNKIHLSGEISENGGEVEEWIAVWEPTDYALHIFQTALKHQSIVWEGTVYRGQAPRRLTCLYKHHSIPLNKLVIPLMKNSNNTIAEIIIKEMGKLVYGEGSWENGLRVLEREMGEMGMELETMVIRDGSGISHINGIPANQLTKLLYTIQAANWFDIYIHALPVTGAYAPWIGGTLQERMPHLNIRAKTGTIHGVSTLAGYMQKRNGKQLIFSILIDHLIDEEEGKEIEDRILNMIANEDV